MGRLPGHIPLLSVAPSAAVASRSLYEGVLAVLAAGGVRIARCSRPRAFTSPAQLVAALGGNDVLIAEVPAVEGSARLFFTGSAAAAQVRDRRFCCAETADIPGCAARIAAWIEWCAGATPVAGAILIGGRSSRMGHPKHLIEDGRGRTWLENTVTTVAPFVTDLVISGKGRVPAALSGLERIDDLPAVQGPLAGIGALFRSSPFTSWLVAACDMPQLSGAAVSWLLQQRRRGCVAVTPNNPRTGRNEPLLAWYDYRCGPLVEEMIASRRFSVSALCLDAGVLTPRIPDHLAQSWRNVNVPEELQLLNREGTREG